MPTVKGGGIGNSMYLVIGANGFLGSYVIKNILENTEKNILATARNLKFCDSSGRVKWVSCEITNDGDIKNLIEEIDGNEIDVIYLSAYHKPDEVQENPRLAWDINIIALSKILNLLKNVRCFFYASTDSVYGNSIDGYHFKEEDRLSPENIYGLQKKTAEALVVGYGYNVVRYPFLIGKSLLKHKKHFYDLIAETISKGESFDMFSDSYRSSLDFDTAAFLLIKLIEAYREDYPKVLNISGDKDLSKYDVGLLIAKHIGCNFDLIKPVSIEDKNKIFKSPRALSTLLDNSKLKSVLNLDEIVLKF